MLCQEINNLSEQFRAYQGKYKILETEFMESKREFADREEQTSKQILALEQEIFDLQGQLTQSQSNEEYLESVERVS